MGASERPPAAAAHSGRRSFAVLARGSCAHPDRLLLALAAEFRAVDWEQTLERLDALARPLFGIAALDPDAAARRLLAGLGREEGLLADLEGVDGLLLDCVVRSGRGHPALLALLYSEVGRRAGVTVRVLSSPECWYAGVEGEAEVVLIDPAPASHSRPAASQPVRSYCGHELAYAVLGGLARRFDARGAGAEAERARLLSEHLPVVRACGPGSA